MRLGADLRSGGGCFKDVGMKEGAGRGIVEVWHGVRLIGGRSEVVVVRSWVVVAWLVRTKPGWGSHPAEVLVIVKRIRRQKTSSRSAATDVIELLVFNVTSGSGVVHGRTVSGRGGGRGDPGALVGTRTAPDGESRAGSRAPSSAVRSRLVVVVGAGKIGVGRGRWEADKASLGTAGWNPASTRKMSGRIQVHTRGRRSSTSAWITRQKITLTIDAVEIRTQRLSYNNTI